MDIIYELKQQGSEALRVSTSAALPRKNTIRIHHHIMIELSLVLKGNGVYKSSGRTYSIKEGDVFLFRPNEAHCITDIDDDGMAILNIHISPSYLYTAFPNALNSEYIKILVTSFNIDGNKINDFLPDPDMTEILSLFLMIKDECEKKQSDYLTSVINQICNILIKISRPYSDVPMEKGKKQSYQNVISAMSYIDQHFNEQLTLGEIADSIGYSRCYFSDIFKKCLGMSVWEYISIKRIEQALYLIKTTNKNILQIATECGFNNTANFNKIFKKYTHLSPHDFRS